MNRQDTKVKLLVCSVLLLRTVETSGYTNPIDSQTTEMITNLWDLGAASLQVGMNNHSNTLVITNGGQIESHGGDIGSTLLPSNHNRVIVTGTNSAWISSGNISLGSENNELLITDGGRVNSVESTLGLINGKNNLVTVSGAGSVWSNSARLWVGAIGEYNTTIVTNGGQLYSTGCQIGAEPSFYSRLAITGAGSTYQNAGELFLGYESELSISSGGRMENTRASVYFSSATVTGDGSIWHNSGELTVRTQSSISVSTGGTISATSLILSDAGSTLHLQSGGTLSLSGDFDAGQAGMLDFTGGTLAVGGTLTNLSMLDIGCRLEAADIAGDLTVQGTFTPGSSLAAARIDGRFLLAESGTLEMKLGGNLEGTEYDTLTVTDEAALNGMLKLIFLNTFSPTNGASFALFNFNGGVSGTFATTNLPTLTGGLSWNTDHLYTRGTIDVVPEPTTILLMGLGGIIAWLGRRALASNEPTT